MILYAYAFDAQGNCLEAGSRYEDGVVPVESFQANYPGCLLYIRQTQEVPEITDNKDLAYLKAVIEDGQVVSISLDPAWSPPATPSNPLEEIRDLVAANILASAHDRRWLAQKEAAKRLGIPWLKANPGASQTDFEGAIGAALVNQFPGEPIVLNPEGLIESYVLVAQGWGVIPEATYIALRDLVVATSDTDLAALLARL